MEILFFFTSCDSLNHQSHKTSSEFRGALIADGSEQDCRHRCYFLVQHVFSHMGRHPVLCCANDLASASPEKAITIGFISLQPTL